MGREGGNVVELRGAAGSAGRFARLVAGRVTRPSRLNFRSRDAATNELHTDLQAVGLEVGVRRACGGLEPGGPEDDEIDDAEVTPRDAAGRHEYTRVPPTPLVALGPDSTDRTAAARGGAA